MSSEIPARAEVLVVGAGLAGLACGRILNAAGVDVHIIEASDGIGGRVRTDEVEGFLLDRGFQVLLTAYEELQRQVDVEALELQRFSPGSLVWDGKDLLHLADPWRNPGSALSSLRVPVGSFMEKLKVGKLRHQLLSNSPESCFHGPDRSTQDELEAMGLSGEFIDTFFRPFLGGVFLERALETSAHLFRYYFRCFSAGDATLPAGGMGRLPEVLAEPLTHRIHLNAPVVGVETAAGGATHTGVRLGDGRVIQAEQVVLAVDGGGAAELLGEPVPAYKATVTSYFAARRAPTDKPLLVLDGEGTGPANHVAVVSNVAPRYAPVGSHLVSVSGVDEAADDPQAFRLEAPKQLRRWFGETVDEWEHLRTYRIPHALPRHPAGSLDDRPRNPVREDGLIVAGDYMEFGAIQGALLSGRRAAEAVGSVRASLPHPG